MNRKFIGLPDRKKPACESECCLRWRGPTSKLHAFARDYMFLSKTHFARSSQQIDTIFWVSVAQPPCPRIACCIGDPRIDSGLTPHGLTIGNNRESHKNALWRIGRCWTAQAGNPGEAHKHDSAHSGLRFKSETSWTMAQQWESDIVQNIHGFLTEFT